METLQRTANRGSLATGYDVDNSLKFEPDNSEYLGKTPASSGNRRTFTISMWVKRTELIADSYLMEAGDGDYNQSDRTLIKFDATDNFRFGGGSAYQRTTTRVFRDTSAWYHIVMAVDTTDATAGDRLKLYVNGVQETSFSTSADPSQDFEYAFCKDDEHTIGYNHTDNGAYYGGYMSEVILVDGQQLAPTSFGEFDDDSGIWKPIDVSGLTFGTNGFYLDFSDSANLGNDASGGTDFTLNNITSADQSVDSPSNNFCTLLATSPSGTYYKRIRDGGTSYQSVTNAWTSCWSTIPLYSGKWYAEFKRTAEGGAGNIFVGAGGIDHNLYYYNLIYVGANGSGTTFSVGLFSTNGDFYSGTGVTGSSYATGDIICLAVDQDNGAIYFRKNDDAWMGDGTNAGDPSSGASRTGAQIIDWGTATNLAISNYSNNDETEANYGGYSCMSNSRTYSDDNGYGLFVYEPPTGYLAICSKNLAETG